MAEQDDKPSAAELGQVNALEIVRSARDFGLKSRKHRSSWRRLDRTPVGVRSARRSSLA